MDKPIKRFCRMSGAVVETFDAHGKPSGDYVLSADHDREIATANARIAEFERILDGLPQDAIDGGWTARGISAYAKKLEDQIATLTDSSEKVRKDAERYRWLSRRVVITDGSTPGMMVITAVDDGVETANEFLDEFTEPALAALQPKDAREA